MISEKVIKALEYDKVLLEIAKYAVLETGKVALSASKPVADLQSVTISLDKTAEAVKLLFTHNASAMPFSDDITAEAERARIGGSLSCGELIKVASALRIARVLKTSIERVNDEAIVLLRELASRLFTDKPLEDEISEKILSEDTVADTASDKLYTVRKQIKTLNARIRDKLNSYIRGGASKFLQDNIVTVRGDRYVIPVRAEFKGSIKGFIHDQSASGATVFIEPEQVMEYNNELKTALIEEANEIRRILQELSGKVGSIAESIRWNTENLTEIDVIYAKAIYSYKNDCIYPKVNSNGKIDIIKGRHPLILREKVVPVTVNLGENYRFLLITGPNTGGKTVTLKLTGLLTALMMTGVFVPCAAGSTLSVFNDIFCDIGDEQSIEQNLSTFSSHMKNIIDITEHLTNKSLILLDEIGAGTDPEEGAGLALAVIERLLSADCCGIITTHYSKLKEYAFGNEKIENASMDFDTDTFAPLYRLNIGVPGSSNAIEISRRLGLDPQICNSAMGFMTENKISFENILRQAEESRNRADRISTELEIIKSEKERELETINIERERLQKEREKLASSVRTETRRLVNERVYEAEELLEELKDLLKKETHSGADIITARTLKNKIEEKRYTGEEPTPEKQYGLQKANLNLISTGDKVFYEKLGAEAEIIRIIPSKKQAEISIGVIKTIVPISELFIIKSSAQTKQKHRPVAVGRQVDRSMTVSEINVIGQTVLEGVENARNFIDNAVVNGLEEIKIIHGVGTGRLKAGIWELLRGHKNVKEFRSGRYGEGEKGVTVITLK